MPILARFVAIATCPVRRLASASPPLATEEQRRLDGGEVFILSMLPPGGAGKSGQGGTVVGPCSFDARAHPPSRRPMA